MRVAIGSPSLADELGVAAVDARGGLVSGDVGGAAPAPPPSHPLFGDGVSGTDMDGSGRRVGQGRRLIPSSETVAPGVARARGGTRGRVAGLAALGNTAMAGLVRLPRGRDGRRRMTTTT